MDRYLIVLRPDQSLNIRNQGWVKSILVPSSYRKMCVRVCVKLILSIRTSTNLVSSSNIDLGHPTNWKLITCDFYHTFAGRRKRKYFKSKSGLQLKLKKQRHRFLPLLIGKKSWSNLKRERHNQNRHSYSHESRDINAEVLQPHERIYVIPRGQKDMNSLKRLVSGYPLALVLSYLLI